MVYPSLLDHAIFLRPKRDASIFAAHNEAMSIVLSHSTARAFHDVNFAAVRGSLPLTPRMLSDATPTAKLIHAARDALFEAGVPHADTLTLDVLIPHTRQKRNLPGIRCHTFAGALPARSLIRLTPGVFVAGIELCAQQAAEYLTFLELVEFYLNICSSFFDEFTFASVPQKTSTDQLERFFMHLQGAHGIKRARRALAYTRDRARSPKEIALGMALMLPASYGGLSIRKLVFDRRIALTDAARLCSSRQHLVCDIYLAHGNIDVEYNGRSHSEAMRRAADEERADALARMGLRLVNISAGSLYSCDAFRRRLRVILTHQHRKIPPDHDVFWLRQEALRQFILRNDDNNHVAPTASALP